MPEVHEHRLKRLQMRSMRRGIKEMDLILSAYAEARLPQMDDAGLTLYAQLLNENDHDLYLLVSGQTEAPEKYSVLVTDIRGQLAEARG